MNELKTTEAQRKAVREYEKNNCIKIECFNCRCSENGSIENECFKFGRSESGNFAK